MDNKDFVLFLLTQFSKYISFAYPKVIVNFDLVDDDYYEVSIIDSLDNSALIIFYVFDSYIDIKKIEITEESIITFGTFDYTSNLQLFYHFVQLTYEFLQSKIQDLYISDIIAFFTTVKLQSLMDFVIYILRLNFIPFTYFNKTLTVPNVCSFSIQSDKVATFSLSGVASDMREYTSDVELFKILIDLLSIFMNSYSYFRVIMDSVLYSVTSPENVSDEEEEQVIEDNNKDEFSDQGMARSAFYGRSS